MNKKFINNNNNNNNILNNLNNSQNVNEEAMRKQIKEAINSNQNKIFHNHNNSINTRSDLKLSKSIGSPYAHADLNKRNKFMFEYDKEKINDVENNYQYHQLKNFNKLPRNNNNISNRDSNYDYNTNAKLNFTKEKKNIYVYGKDF